MSLQQMHMSLQQMHMSLQQTKIQTRLDAMQTRQLYNDVELDHISDTIFVMKRDMLLNQQMQQQWNQEVQQNIDYHKAFVSEINLFLKNQGNTRI